MNFVLFLEPLNGLKFVCFWNYALGFYLIFLFALYIYLPASFVSAEQSFMTKSFTNGDNFFY